MKIKRKIKKKNVKRMKKDKKINDNESMEQRLKKKKKR